MPVKTFLIPVRNPVAAEAKLNRLLAQHTVLRLDREWVPQGESSYWAVWVYFAEEESGTPPTLPLNSQQANPTPGKKQRVDYKEKLTPDQFTLYLKLREWRKRVATQEGVALYAVFTNDQLAELVTRQVTTKAALQTIQGVGDGRVEKYGPEVLEYLIANGVATLKQTENEKSR